MSAPETFHIGQVLPAAPAKEKPAFDRTIVHAWFVIHVSGRSESDIVEDIEKNGVIVFRPVIAKWSRIRRGEKASAWRARRAPVEHPLFPRYMFVALPAADPDFGAVAGVKGVVGFIGAGGAPLRVEPLVIARMQHAQIIGVFDETRKPDGTREERQAASPYQPGTVVKVVDGPFCDMWAEVLDAPAGERLRVLLRMGQHELKAELSVADIL